MKHIVPLLTLALAGCVSGHVESIGGNQHKIEASSGDISYPPHMKYATDKNVGALYLQKSVEACPNGHKKISEKYNPAKDGQQDSYQWIIECIEQ